MPYWKPKEVWTDSPTEFQRPQVAPLGMVAGMCSGCNQVVMWSEPHGFVVVNGFLRIKHRGCDTNEDL